MSNPNDLSFCQYVASSLGLAFVFSLSTLVDKHARIQRYKNNLFNIIGNMLVVS